MYIVVATEHIKKKENENGKWKMGNEKKKRDNEKLISV